MRNQNEKYQEHQQNEENQNFSYQKFQKTSSFPVPAIAQNAKYNKILPLSELCFLQYYMLPEKDEFDYVYRPGDDSFFMLNVLKQQLNEWINQWGQKDINKNMSKFSNCIIAQLGSGSGILSAHVSSWLKKMDQSPLIHVSIDINMDASSLSQKYYDQYSLPVLQINTSLFRNTVFSQKEGTLSKIKPQIIIFNPPYIPVDPEEIQSEHKYLVQKIKQTVETKQVIRKREQNMIAYSYMGGLDGLMITRKLLKSVFWNCWLYLIVMGEEGYVQLKQELNNYKQFWSQHSPKNHITSQVQLMQFMKYQNQDLFLIRVEIISS